MAAPPRVSRAHRALASRARARTLRGRDAPREYRRALRAVGARGGEFRLHGTAAHRADPRGLWCERTEPARSGDVVLLHRSEVGAGRARHAAPFALAFRRARAELAPIA